MYNATAEGDPFPEDVLSRLFRQLTRFDGGLRMHDLDGVRASVSEVAALRELLVAAELSQQHLGELLGLEKSTVSRLVSGLQARGWLLQERDPVNRRFARLRLTSVGKTVAHRIGRHLTQRHAQLLGAMTEQERRALALGLSGVARVLEQLRNQDLSGHLPDRALTDGRPRSETPTASQEDQRDSPVRHR